MDDFSGTDEPWFKTYQDAVFNLVHINIAEEENKYILDRKKIILIAKNLILKIKFLTESLNKESCNNHIRSGDEQLFELFSLCERIEEEQKKSEAKVVGNEMDVLGYSLMTFKITILIHDKYLYDEDSDPEFAEIVSEFIKSSLSFLTIYHPSIKVLGLKDKGEDIVKHAALIILIAPDNRVHLIINKILPFILESIENLYIKVFINCLISYERTSFCVLNEVLIHFSGIEFMKTLGQDFSRTPQRFNLLLSLLDDVLESISKFQIKITAFHKVLLEKITHNQFLLISESENPSVHLHVLKCMFLKLQNEDFYSLKIHMEDRLPVMFNAFHLWLLTPVISDTFNLLLETCLLCFSSFSSNSCRLLLPHAKTFIKCVIYAIKANSGLAAKALVIFENFMDDVDFCCIDFLISSLKEDLLRALMGALKSPVESVNKSAFMILGKMGGSNRDTFKTAPKLHEAEVTTVILEFNEGSINFPFSKIIDVAYGNLCSDNDIERKKHALTVLKILLSSYVNSCALDSCSSIGFSTSTSEERVMKSAPKSQYLKKTLMAIFVALEVPEFSSEIKPFVEEVITAFLHKANDEDIDLDLQLLTDVALNVMCLPKDNVNKVNITALEIIVKKTIELDGCESSFFRHLYKKLINLCYKPSWEAKVVACKGIKLLSEVTPKDYWLVNHITILLKPLIHASVDVQGKISFGSISFIKHTIHEIIYICFNSKDKDIEEMNRANEVVDEFLKVLIQGMISQNHIIRKTVSNF